MRGARISPMARHRTKQKDFGRRLEGGGDTILNTFYLDFKLVERCELHLNHGCRIAG
jgi:hypothetical protein